jgi:oligopeptide transport system substrate-binding protein
LIAVVIAGLLLAGCSGQPQGQSSEVMVGNFFIPTKIKGFDPVLAEDLYSHVAMKQIYEGMYQYAYLKRPYEVESCLADGMPQVSEDRLTVTISIKHGIRFQDDPCFTRTGGKGRELVAEDFVFSFKRLADVRNKPTGWWIFNDRIVGLNAFREKTIGAQGMAIYDEPVEGLSALDNYTLRIKLTEPYPQLKYVLTMMYTSAVPREAVEFYAAELLNHPVGTGPYRLSSWVRGSKIVYEKNPTFRKELYPSEGEPRDRELGLLDDAGKPLPFMDRVNVFIITQTATMWQSFMSGDLDRAGIPKESYDRAIDANKNLRKELQDKGIKLWKEPMLDLVYVAFNMLDPVLGKNLKLRQAISLAVNRERIIDDFYNHRAILAQGPIPPGLSGYDPNLKNPFVRYDVDEAQRLLAEAGYAEGTGLPKFTFDSQGEDPTARQMDEAMINDLSRVGIKTSYVVNTWPKFLERINEKKGQIWGAAWGADYPDPENFLQLLYGPNESPGTNGSNYENPEYDRLYEKMRSMDDGPQRRAIIKQMVAIVIRDCPWVFIAHRLSFVLQHAWLKDYKPHDLAPSEFKYYKIDTVLRTKLLKKL